MLLSRLFPISFFFLCFDYGESNVYSVLDSLHSMLSYYNNHPEHVDHNLVFGLLIVKGKVSVLKDSEEDEIRNNAGAILEICDKLLDRHKYDWSITEHASNFMNALSKEGKNDDLKMAAIDYSVGENLEVGSPSRSDSDFCLLEALIDGEFGAKCENIETDPNARGYTLIHQAIYYTLKSYLSENESSKAKETVHKICERILAENRQIMKVGFSLQLQDLYVEQVAVCGMKRYREFLTDSTLRMILSLQTSRGCFAMREKRKHLQVDCYTHLSSVCGAAMSHFIP